ncbi:hypothetical protein PAECIP111893_00350 [Paenibacillus plantiphilus]|uniref:Oxidoreductase n=1 Tax=Paenibacillus plantiphilus TaxID=2905650 RepID=A0ABN8FY51_9BACL|nr:Gfo/Idh/MocA family oxidoreductase [Paenibacillus plantiphilus]CAH1192884.1 hypothetical protein PAECIP111893_00350 [Paenibacillus plantiphilus]
MKAIVVGFGSIGERHTRLLQSMNIETAVVSERKINFPYKFTNISEAIQNYCPDYIVIANKTNQHHSALLQVLASNFQGKVLVEKPLYHRLLELPENHQMDIFVAYNLRFHPLLQRLKSALTREHIISATIYTGQYLPDWRPNTDYRASYSARINDGGGVIRDLSHELDYANFLFGKWRRLSAIGGKYSSLEITSDDSFSLLVEMERCPQVQIQVNYLDRMGRREIIVNTDLHTYKIDFSNRTFQLDKEIFHIDCDRDDTYEMQHDAIVQGVHSNLCEYEDGLNIVRMIEAIECSASQKEWIINA